MLVLAFAITTIFSGVNRENTTNQEAAVKQQELISTQTEKQISQEELEEKERKKVEAEKAQREKNERDAKINDLLEDIASQENRTWNGTDMFVVIDDGGIFGDDIYMDMRRSKGTRENFVCSVGKSDGKVMAVFKNDKYNFLTVGNVVKVRKDGGISFNIDEKALKEPTEEDMKIYNGAKKYFTSYANIPKLELDGLELEKIADGKFLIRTLYKEYPLIVDVNSLKIIGEPGEEGQHIELDVNVPEITKLKWSIFTIPNSIHDQFGGMLILRMKVTADNGASKDFYVRQHDRVASVIQITGIIVSNQANFKE